jgi:glycosyltransferase involved in cell wall biosynthesis
MKVLQIGPFPPPHGGVSVHVYQVRRQLLQSGIACRVVNVDPRAPRSGEYISIRSGVGLFFTLFRHARRGWLLHVQTNGHNHKSWLVALTAGLAGRLGPGSLLTLHSGMVPEYLGREKPGSLLARFTCSLFDRIIVVAPEIKEAVRSLGVLPTKIDLLPAFLYGSASNQEVPELQRLKGRRPLLGVTLSFRPEYGFDLLVEAICQLRRRHPEIACLVMGGGEGQSQAERLVRDRGLRNHILFMGNVEHDKCLSIISRCDLFVRPTLVDGDANSVREALALEIPVVASNVGNRPDGAILFRAGDADDLVAKLSATIAEACFISMVPRKSACLPTSSGQIRSLIDIYSSLETVSGTTARPIAALRKEQWGS